MHPVAKLLLLAAVVFVVFWLVTRFRDRVLPEGRRRPQTGPPVPVHDLPQQVRQSIDHAIAADRTTQAIKMYRDSTGASLEQASEAIDRRARGRGR